MGKSIVIIIAIVFLGAGAYFALFNNSSPRTAYPTPQATEVPSKIAPTPAPTIGMPVIGGTTTPEMQVRSLLKTFTITGTNYAFSPSEIRVSKRDTVRITFKNEGGFHTFNIGEYHIATSQLQTGNVEAVQFVADKSGSFEYYCSIGQHRAMGMKGTLIVE